MEIQKLPKTGIKVVKKNQLLLENLFKIIIMMAE